MKPDDQAVSYADRYVPEDAPFLKATCGPVKIEKVCIVDNAHGVDDSEPAFQDPFTESDARGEDLPATVSSGSDYAIQVDYIAETLNGSGGLTKRAIQLFSLLNQM